MRLSSTPSDLERSGRKQKSLRARGLTLERLEPRQLLAGDVLISELMAHNTDGRLEVLIASPVTRRRILTLLPKIMSGSHLQEPEISHGAVTHLTIHADELIASQLDGEVQPLGTTFKIKILPGALRLL
ncbi:MAG: hypothetical protein IIC12_01575 [Proteobacteria bacterium]|nr:hypothetical protein [Pseudomonadota bacterium]